MSELTRLLSMGGSSPSIGVLTSRVLLTDELMDVWCNANQVPSQLSSVVDCSVYNVGTYNQKEMAPRCSRRSFVNVVQHPPVLWPLYAFFSFSEPLHFTPPPPPPHQSVMIDLPRISCQHADVRRSFPSKLSSAHLCGKLEHISKSNLRSMSWQM